MPRGPRPRRVPVIRYELPDGTRCTKGTPGAVRRRTLTDTYYAKLSLGGRKATRVPLGTDERQAWEELRRLQRREAERKLGIRDDYHDAAERPYADHVEDWHRWLQDQGRDPTHVAALRAHCLKLADLAGWRRVGQIDGPSCASALARLRDAEGLAAQTRNHYLAHAKQFCRWLWQNRRLRDHPLAGLKPASVADDRRHDRRCPTDDEVALLFAWLESDDPRTAVAGRRVPARCGMTGPQRALLYQTAMATGFRAGEMRSLSPGSFDLAADPPTVTVRAGYSRKAKRTVTQPLPLWLADRLRAWFAAGGGCWQTLPESHPGDVLQRDLADAGVQYATPAPGGDHLLYFDFHALRTWFVTALANQSGISPKTMMILARHSTPHLTLNVYAKARMADLSEAANQIPEPGRADPKGRRAE